MARKATAGILTATGIDYLEVCADSRKPVVLVGLILRPCQDAISRAAKREREEIARTYFDLGYEVFESHHNPDQPPTRENSLTNEWPNDHFTQIGNTIIPADSTFRELGQGGNYVCGHDFVLISRSIERLFLKKHLEHAEFRRAFAGKELYFIEPYFMRLKTRAQGIRKIALNHIDLTIGILPKELALTIADVHYAAIGSQIHDIARRHGLRILTTSNDPPDSYHPFVNNYFVVSPGRRDQLIVANRYEGFYKKLSDCGAQVHAPRRPITRLAVYRGSIKCVSNQAPSAAVFDKLGIACRRWKPDARPGRKSSLTEIRRG